MICYMQSVGEVIFDPFGEASYIITVFLFHGEKNDWDKEMGSKRCGFCS